MPVVTTLEKVQSYLSKSAFATDAESETGRLLSEVTDVLGKLRSGELLMGSSVNTNQNNNVLPLQGGNQRTRAAARLHRSQTVVASSRPTGFFAKDGGGGVSNNSLGVTGGSSAQSRSPSAQARDLEMSQRGSLGGSLRLNTSQGEGGGGGSAGSPLQQQDATLLTPTSDAGGAVDGGEEEGGFPEVSDDVADWLNKNFADTTQEREDAGFDIPVLRRESTAVGFGEMRRSAAGSADGGSNHDGLSPTASGTAAAAASASTTSEPEHHGGHDAAASSSAGAAAAAGASRVVYTRTHSRKTNAREAPKRVRRMLMEAGGFADLSENGVHTPDFDIFALLDEYRRDCNGSLPDATAKLFVTVCLNIFCSYSFVQSLDFDIAKLVAFFRAQEQLYGNNPYHNAVHAADVLQTTHMYLMTNHVYQNFSDTELFSVLFAAGAHDLGHLGTSNVFLQNISHPTAVLYNDTSVQENYHTALAFHLLRQPGTDFLAGSKVWTDALHRDFRSCVVDVIWGTDMKNHATLSASASSILEDGVIEDAEVPALMRAIVHAADLSNPLKQWSVYMEWASRVVGEFWRQGDEEQRRGSKISPMCDRNGANFAKAQKGFIEFVVRPWMRTLERVLPPIWLERLEANLQQVNGMTQAEIDDVHVRIATHAATPLDDTVAKRVMDTLRAMVSPPDNGTLRCRSLADNPLLRAKARLAAEQAAGGGAQNASSSSSKQAVVKPMHEMTVPEIVERIKASWSDIIKGLTSRGSLSRGGAIEQWSRVLLEAHSVTRVLNLDADASVMQSLASDVADKTRAALEKLQSRDFAPDFTFVRTLTITILDMTRPVIKAANASSPPPAYPLSAHSSTLAGGFGNTPSRTVFVDHYGNNLEAHGAVAASGLPPPSTMLLSQDTLASRNSIVRFFSEERPVIVPLESKFAPYERTPNRATTPSRNM